MGADSLRDMGGAVEAGFSISIQLDDEADAERIFNAFTEARAVIMPNGRAFWAKKFGMVTDRYGTPWMINCGTAG